MTLPGCRHVLVDPFESVPDIVWHLALNRQDAIAGRFRAAENPFWCDQCAEEAGVSAFDVEAAGLADAVYGVALTDRAPTPSEIAWSLQQLPQRGGGSRPKPTAFSLPAAKIPDLLQYEIRYELDYRLWIVPADVMRAAFGSHRVIEDVQG